MEREEPFPELHDLLLRRIDPFGTAPRLGVKWPNDLLYEGRWGGLITGDKVTVDFKPRCPCGRHGPTLLDAALINTKSPGVTWASSTSAP